MGISISWVKLAKHEPQVPWMKKINTTANIVTNKNRSCLSLKSKKSPTGPTELERTPKLEYLIALATFFGGPLVRSHSIFDG